MEVVWENRSLPSRGNQVRGDKARPPGLEAFVQALNLVCERNFFIVQVGDYCETTLARPDRERARSGVENCRNAFQVGLEVPVSPDGLNELVVALLEKLALERLGFLPGTFRERFEPFRSVRIPGRAGDTSAR